MLLYHHKCILNVGPSVNMESSNRVYYLKDNLILFNITIMKTNISERKNPLQVVTCRTGSARQPTQRLTETRSVRVSQYGGDNCTAYCQNVSLHLSWGSTCTAIYKCFNSLLKRLMLNLVYIFNISFASMCFFKFYHLILSAKINKPRSSSY